MRTLDSGPAPRAITQNIQYSAWRKLCFKGSDGATLCRTTFDRHGACRRSSGTCRLDRTPRWWCRPLPGSFRKIRKLAMGVKATVDQAAPTKIPYNFCLTNICIAADLASPKLIGEMESGQILKLEQADFNSSTIAMNICLLSTSSPRLTKARQQRLTTITLTRTDSAIALTDLFFSEGTNVVTGAHPDAVVAPRCRLIVPRYGRS